MRRSQAATSAVSCGREEELVQIGSLPSAGREPRDLAVGAVEDHVLSVAEPVLGLPLPPGEHGLALVEAARKFVAAR